MKRCPNCQLEVEEEVKVCPSCQYMFEESAKTKKVDIKLLFIIFAVILLVLFPRQRYIRIWNSFVGSNPSSNNGTKVVKEGTFEEVYTLYPEQLSNIKPIYEDMKAIVDCAETLSINGVISSGNFTFNNDQLVEVTLNGTIGEDSKTIYLSYEYNKTAYNSTNRIIAKTYLTYEYKEETVETFAKIMGINEKDIKKAFNDYYKEYPDPLTAKEREYFLQDNVRLYLYAVNEDFLNVSVFITYPIE